MGAWEEETRTKQISRYGALPEVSTSGSLLTLREAAEVLRLHPRTVREYVRGGEIEGGSSAGAGGSAGVTLMLSMKMHLVAGTSRETMNTGIRWWNSENRLAAGASNSSAPA